MNKFQSFRHYYQETVREYHYRIKTLVPMDDETLTMLEKVLQKYDLKDIQAPVKTVLQRHPMDFNKVSYGEVWIIDITTGLPASSFIMREEIRNAMGINEDFIVVRGENDPMEVQTEKGHAEWEMDQEAAKDGMTPGSLLGTDPLYMDGEQTPDGKTMYGDVYNSKLTDYLAAVAKSRKEMEIKPSSPLFDFIETSPKDIEKTEDFNAEFDAPKPKPWWEAVDDADMSNERIAKPGNYDDDGKKYSKVYLDKNQDKVELSTTANSIRNGKYTEKTDVKRGK